MQAMELARICVRIIALVLIYQGITVLPEMAIVWRDYELDLYLSAWVLLFAVVKILPLIAGALFWWKTDLICRWFVKFNLPPSPVIKVSLRQLLSTGMFCVGLLITLNAIPDLASYGVSYYFKWNLPNTPRIFSQSILLTRMVMAFFETVTGVGLLLTAPHLSRWMMSWWPVEPVRGK